MRIPKKVEPASTTELYLEWNTGEKMRIPYAELRFHCPCASCVDEHTGVRVLKREFIPNDIRPKKVEPVGQYALQFTWSDGHSTGIFHFDRLFQIGEKYPFPSENS
jgi:DUF971 family protein